jgi:putative colanic acid biosysnthesis UDP-glucose lipid carrier transferase
VRRSAVKLLAREELPGRMELRGPVSVPVQSALPSASLASLASRAMFRKAARVAVGRAQLLNLFEMALEPLVLVLSLWGAALLTKGALGAHHMILSMIVFALTFPSEARLSQSAWRAIRNTLAGWLALSALLFFFGYASGLLEHFDEDTLIAWGLLAPAGLVGTLFLLRLTAPAIQRLEGGPKRAVVAGMNEAGMEFARRLSADRYSGIRVVGFVDDRARQRLEPSDDFSLLGSIEQLSHFVQKNRIELVYLALPMASQPRIVSLLEQLRDTTASVYFVPDMFVTELIQGRIDSISGMPVLGVCDSPFCGTSGLIKRASDIVLASTILALVAPLLLALAVCVKLSSPGRVIFRQRRYGLDGEEITVYKFRTMTVMEDGDSVRQCARADERVTRLGAFMRRLSLDELPQLINVLQGRMSIVGPRPHAVAHNEMYRRLIKGYMQRHKVRPGITGWAQVNGCRGETRTLEQMKARLDYDLDYLRNWSPGMDLYIIVKTLWVVLKGEHAY